MHVVITISLEPTLQLVHVVDAVKKHLFLINVFNLVVVLIKNLFLDQ